MNNSYDQRKGEIENFFDCTFMYIQAGKKQTNIMVKRKYVIVSYFLVTLVHFWGRK